MYLRKNHGSRIRIKTTSKVLILGPETNNLTGTALGRNLLFKLIHDHQDLTCRKYSSQRVQNDSTHLVSFKFVKVEMTSSCRMEVHLVSS